LTRPATHLLQTRQSVEGGTAAKIATVLPGLAERCARLDATPRNRGAGRLESMDVDLVLMGRPRLDLRINAMPVRRLAAAMAGDHPASAAVLAEAYADSMDREDGAPTHSAARRVAIDMIGDPSDPQDAVRRLRGPMPIHGDAEDDGAAVSRGVGALMLDAFMETMSNDPDAQPTIRVGRPGPYEAPAIVVASVHHFLTVHGPEMPGDGRFDEMRAHHSMIAAVRLLESMPTALMVSDTTQRSAKGKRGTTSAIVVRPVDVIRPPEGALARLRALAEAHDLVAAIGDDR
jgi:hypothetical protein